MRLVKDTRIWPQNPVEDPALWFMRIHSSILLVGMENIEGSCSWRGNCIWELLHVVRLSEEVDMAQNFEDAVYAVCFMEAYKLASMIRLQSDPTEIGVHSGKKKESLFSVSGEFMAEGGLCEMKCSCRTLLKVKSTNHGQTSIIQAPWSYPMRLKGQGASPKAMATVFFPLCDQSHCCLFSFSLLPFPSSCPCLSLPPLFLLPML